MLAQFIWKRTFNRISVSLWVDSERNEAELMIKEGRLLRRTEKVPFHEVRTPELAGKWMTRPVEATGGQLGLLEYLDHCAARGLWPFERRAA